MPLPSDLTRPIPLTAIGLALVGWVIAAWSLIDARSEQAASADLVAGLRRQADQTATELRTERAAAGSLADVETRRTTTLADIAAAQTSLRAAEKARDEAKAQFKSTEDNLQQLAGQQSSLQQSVAQSDADLDKVKIDLEAAVRRDAAIKIESAQADNDLMAARTQLSTTMASRATAEAALTALTAKNAARGRDVAARQATADDLARRNAAAEADLATARAALPPLQAQRDALTRQITTAMADRERLTADQKAAQTALAELKTSMAETTRARDAVLADQRQKADMASAEALDAAQQLSAARAALDGITALIATRRGELKRMQDALDAKPATTLPAP